MTECKNCGTSFNGDFCNNCGQRRLNGRLKLKDVFANSLDLLFNVDKGIIFTTKELTIRPGTVVSEYLDGKRIKYFSPFKFLIVFVAINTFLSLKITEYGTKARIIDISETNSNTLTLLLNDYWDLLSLLMVPIYATLSTLLFKEYNYTEHLVLNSYVIGYQNLLGSIYYLLFLIFCPDCGTGIYPMLLGLLFFTWCYMHLFKKRPILTFIKLIATFVLGWTLWGLILFGAVWTLK